MHKVLRATKSHRVVNHAFVVALASVTLMIAPGCNTGAPAPADGNYNPESGLTLNEHTVLAPRALSDKAKVTANSVTMPDTEELEAWASSLHPGDVIAGNRDTTQRLDQSKNPYGFVRRVESVGVVGDTIEIATSRAELKDAFSGRINFDAPSIFMDAPRAANPSATGISTKSLHTLDNTSVDTSKDSKKTTFATVEGEPKTTKSEGGLTVSLEDTSFNIDANGTGEGPKIEVQTEWTEKCTPRILGHRICQDFPKSVDVEAQAAKFDVKTTYDFKTTLDFVASGNAEVEFPGPSLIASFPAGPIPLTLKMTPSLRCYIEGEGHVKATANVNGYISMGATVGTDFDVRSGAEFGHGFDIVEADGSVTAGCEVKGTASLLVIGLAGPEGSLSFDVSGKAETCDASGGGKGVKKSAKLALNGQLGLSLVGRSFPLLSGTLWEKEFPESAQQVCCSLADGRLYCPTALESERASCTQSCTYPAGFVGPIPANSCRQGGSTCS